MHWKDLFLLQEQQSSGSVIEMRLVDSSPDSEYMASKSKDTNGCYVVPAFTGLGAPHWDQYARGTIVGITEVSINTI